MVYTLIAIMWNNAQAQEFIDRIELDNEYMVHTMVQEAPELPVGERKIKGLDLVKLTRSVAQAETGNGTKGHGATINNLCGIMHWPGGVRKPVVYDTYMDGFNACYSLIKRKYQEYTIEGMADKWTGSDRAITWSKNVQYWYNIYTR